MVRKAALPIPTKASKARVHEFAEHVASEVGFTPGAPLEPIVAKLGGTIVFGGTPHAASGVQESISVKASGDFVIYLPTTTSPQRDRFTIAHELGHLFLHFPMVQKSAPNTGMAATRWVDPDDKEQQRAEWEANWFAAGFLMPEAPFKMRWASRDAAFTRTMSLAAFFDVSEQAIEVRAKSPGLT